MTTIKQMIVYILIGSLGYGIQKFFYQEQAAYQIILNKSEIEAIKTESSNRTGKLDQEAFDLLVQSKIDQKILLEEAERLELFLNDAIIDKRMIENMKALYGTGSGDDEKILKQARQLKMQSHDIIIQKYILQEMKKYLAYRLGIKKNTEKDIQTYALAHMDRFSSPPTITFTHIFIPKGTPRKTSKNIEERIKNSNWKDEDEKFITKLSYPFHLGQTLKLSEQEIKTNFGQDFLLQLNKQKADNKFGPALASTFGKHFVKITNISERKLLPLEIISHQINSEITNQAEDRNFQVAMKDLRKRYEVVFE